MSRLNRWRRDCQLGNWLFWSELKKIIFLVTFKFISWHCKNILTFKCQNNIEVHDVNSQTNKKRKHCNDAQNLSVSIHYRTLLSQNTNQTVLHTLSNVDSMSGNVDKIDSCWTFDIQGQLGFMAEFIDNSCLFHLQLNYIYFQNCMTQYIG